jgi:hypothetical protein
MTTLPPLCSPANPSRSPSARSLFPLAVLLLLAARGALPVSVAPLMNGSTESLLAMLMGTTLAGLVGWSPFRSPHRAGAHFGPPTEPAFRPQVGGAVTESGCVRRSQVSDSDGRPRLEERNDKGGESSQGRRSKGKPFSCRRCLLWSL